MDDDRAFALESRLTNHGCYLQSVERTGDAYRVRYQSAAASQHGEIPHQQVGDVVNVFRELFEQEDWAVGGVRATVADLDGTELGTWRADREWLRALDAGDLSEVEFSKRVLATLDE